ncbi:MAG TPA: DUF3375 domain-containing protein [Propionibacterium sp.]|jgi:hypothetical protein|nr:DUF3375 domain-containing protein [Propionibacterium sp.]
MSAPTGRAFAYRRLLAEAGLTLLRADLMPVLVAVLGHHLGQQRQLPATEFIELLDEDLAALRDAGFGALPRTATEYLAAWVGDGILIRRLGSGREETVELSAPALAAIRFAESLHQPQSAVTSSRLANVQNLLAELAVDTDPESTSRRQSLLAQRARLDAELAAIDAGHYAPLDPATARERFAEALRLADEIPADFAKVSAELEDLNRGLREQIINNAGSRGGVLEEVFAGVDLIEESEAGRSFRAFFALVLDPERSEAFDAAIDQLLEREFAAGIAPEELAFLRRLLSRLQGESTQVRAVMTGLSRSLRRFVESQAYREHRRLATALQEAQALCLQAAGTMRPFDEIPYALPATSIPLASVGSWALHDPAEARSDRELTRHDNEPLDLDQLREQVRISEIDFTELRAAIVATLRRHAPASLGDVLRHHPASQGLASIVGLMVLAAEAGAVTDGAEDLSWVSRVGVEKTVRARRYVLHHIPETWRRHS